MLLWLYNLILLPLLFPYLAWRLLVRGKSREGLMERFGRLPALGPAPPAGRLWVHAVSMGEAVAAAPVVAALHHALPEAEIIVSTTTPTGQAQARRDLRHVSLFFYFPFDLPWVVARFLERLRPSAIVLMEAEIWPNLLTAARRRGIPVVVANGHLSDRTLRRGMRLRRWLVPMLAGITRYLAQSRTMQERALALGLPPDQIWVTGHTKFDQQVPAMPSGEADALRAAFGLAPQQPLLLAGSTHEGEEELILDAWQTARRAIPDLALMIAPRHLTRVEAIRALIARRGLTVRARSEVSIGPGNLDHHGDPETRRDAEREAVQSGSALSSDPSPPFSVSPGLRGDSEPGHVLLLDKMGELARFYGLATVAFVGGSLVPKGGHDILQPLFHGVPTLFGPFMHNQRALVELCLAAQAARRVVDAADLAETLIHLLKDEAARSAMVGASGRLLLENQGASARCAAVVAELIQERRTPRAATAPALPSEGTLPERCQVGYLGSQSQVERDSAESGRSGMTLRGRESVKL